MENLKLSNVLELVKQPTLTKEEQQKITSLSIRHLDSGSCNGCELELNALSNLIYDIGGHGIRFEASPRHADILILTGCYTRNLEYAVLKTIEAMPIPRILAVGDCAITGGCFRSSYAVLSPEKRATAVLAAIDAVRIRVEGCPPKPERILKALLHIDI